MPQLSKQRVAIAAQNHSKLDVSFTHVTTGEFMQCQVGAYRFMLPKEHLKGSSFVNCRLAPLAVPTYGRCRINVRNFFVPFRQVFPNFNEFITNSLAYNYEDASLVELSPHFYNQDILGMFVGEPSVVPLDDVNVIGLTPINPLNEKLVDVVATYDPVSDHWYDSFGQIADVLAYDFVFHFSLGSDTYDVRCYFTTVGREMYHTFLSLGYRVVWNSDLSKTPISGLALLAYAKVFCDWYFNQNYVDNWQYVSLQKLFKYNDPSSSLYLDHESLFLLLRVTRFCQYDGSNDYITNAWDNPMSPNAGNQLPMSISDITDNGNNTIQMNASYTPYMQQQSEDSNNIGTTYIHSALKAMTDFVKRHQLSSAVAAERFLTEYGIQLDSAQANRSIFISTHSQDVNFDAVFSTADTSAAGDPSNLGDYSGRGTSQGSDEIDFTADEFGIFLSISSIVPMGGYYQGMDRQHLHVSPMDFFINEFDNLGVQAITKSEVYTSNDGNFGKFDDYMGVFGYAPRYAEYKVGRQLVTGDFVLPARFAGGDSWQLFRQFKDANFDGDIANLVHSLNFTLGIDYPQYNRIFQDMNTENDKFYLVYHYALTALAPCKSLYDSYDFDEHFKSVLLHSNGPKVN